MDTITIKDIITSFLQSEINTQELYDDIINFVTSFHVRNGEFEGNEYIIRKMDQTNFMYRSKISRIYRLFQPKCRNNAEVIYI